MTKRKTRVFVSSEETQKNREVFGNIQKFVDLGVLEAGWYILKLGSIDIQSGPYSSEEIASFHAKEKIKRLYGISKKTDIDYLLSKSVKYITSNSL